jgi:serine/threonine protein phosphatase PrpC
MAELRWGAATHPGQIRPQNEDNLLVDDTVFVVADGMGGHEAGEVASEMAVDHIAESLADNPLPSAQQFVDIVNSANQTIFRAAVSDPARHGMGTTVTAIAVIADPHAGRGAPNIDAHDPDSGDAGGETEIETPGDVTPVVPAEPPEALVLANVGDSRTYLFRHERLRRVTVDHNYVQELVATGHISEDEARTHPRRNIITRALGIEPDVKVDWWTLPLIRGDRFLLCSDGLVDYVVDVDIASTLTLESDPQVAADRLVDKANEAGGGDNITIIVLDVLDGDEPPDPTQEIDIIPTWADDDADPTSAGTLEVDADVDALPVPALPDAAATEPSATQPKRKRRALRFLIWFGIAAVLVTGFVVFAAWARSGYYVDFDDSDQAIIYRGRNGGVLWFEPTTDSDGGPTRAQLSDDAIRLVENQPDFDSRADAERFVSGLDPVVTIIVVETGSAGKPDEATITAGA